MKIYFLSTDGITRITDIYEDEIAEANEDGIVTANYEAELPFSEAGISWAADPEVIRPMQKKIMEDAGWHTIPMKVINNG